MKIFKNYYILLSVVLCIFPTMLFSQNNTSSPYSYFGIGDLSNVAHGRNMALGGTGYALRGNGHINLKNPASLTAIDSLSVLFEMGVFGKTTQNTANNNTGVLYDGNLSHVTLAHRINSRIMVNYGLMPYSNIGYYFRTVKAAEGDLTGVISDWNGSGGINKYFGNVGLKITKNISLGGNASMYYGPITQSIKTTALAVPENPALFTQNTKYFGLSFQGAFQYVQPIGKKGSGITIGGVFSPAQLFYGQSTVEVNQFYNSSLAVIYRDEDDTEIYNVPMNYGGGFSYIHRGKVLLTFDMELSPWSQNNTKSYIDRQVYSAGFEILPRRSFDYLKNCSYRFGFRYDTGYFTVRNYPITDTRFTVGMGLPVFNSRSTVNIAFEAGQRGFDNAGLIRERYAQVSVAFSFHDYWFVKRKFD